MSKPVQPTPGRKCYNCSKPYIKTTRHHEGDWWALNCSNEKLCCKACMQNILIVGTASNAVGSVSCCPQHRWTAKNWEKHIGLLFDRKTRKQILQRMKELDSAAGKKIVCSNTGCRATILTVERETETLKFESIAIPCIVSVVKTQATVNEKQEDYEYNPEKPWMPAVPELRIVGGNDIVPSLVNQQRTSDTVCCRNCWTETCVMCKQRAHAHGVDCCMDRELKETIKMAAKMGWKRCGGCHAFFEVDGESRVGDSVECVRCHEVICNYCGSVGSYLPSGRWFISCGCAETTKLGRGLKRLFTSSKTMEKKLFMNTPSAPKLVKS